MDDTDATGANADAAHRPKPVCLIGSALAALAIWPLYWWIERGSAGCADGLCGFFPAVVGGGGLLLASLGLGIAGLARAERPRWWLLLAALSLAALYPVLW